MEKPLLGPEQWLEVGAMEIEDDDYVTIDIGALDIDLLIPARTEGIILDAKLDDQYLGICRAIAKSNTVDKSYSIEDNLLCWKGRIYAPKRTRERIMKSEHDSKVAGHFRRDRTLELISRNFHWPNMEEQIQKFCNECNNCQRRKAPRHAKNGLLHPVERPSQPWTPISTDFITDLP